MRGLVRQLERKSVRAGVSLRDHLACLEAHFPHTFPESHLFQFHFDTEEARRLVMDWFHEITGSDELEIQGYEFEHGPPAVLKVRAGSPWAGSFAERSLLEFQEEWAEDRDMDLEDVPSWRVDSLPAKNLDEEYTAHQWRKLVSGHRAKGL